VSDQEDRTNFLVAAIAGVLLGIFVLVVVMLLSFAVRQLRERRNRRRLDEAVRLEARRRELAREKHAQDAREAFDEELGS
jgi:flagellar biosynthesis/type III secretory pathway M-ring protein FliF/YscJ